jgi:hypothetical protein
MDDSCTHARTTYCDQAAGSGASNNHTASHTARV